MTTIPAQASITRQVSISIYGIAAAVLEGSGLYGG